MAQNRCSAMIMDRLPQAKPSTTHDSELPTIQQLRETLDAQDSDIPYSDQLKEIIKPLKSRVKDISDTQDRERTFAAAILEDLGTRARKELWRAPLAKAGALDLALLALTDEATKRNSYLRKLSYRLIANVCADEDESREILLREWTSFVECFKSDLQGSDEVQYSRTVAGAACAAMLNYLMEFEAATEELNKARLEVVFLHVLDRAHEGHENEATENGLPDVFWDVLLECFERWKLEDTPVEMDKFTYALLDTLDDLAGFPDDDAETWVPILSKLFSQESVRVAFAKNEKRFTQLLRLFHNIQELYEDSNSNELTTKWAPPKTSLADLAPIDGPHLRDKEKTDLWITISMVIGQKEFPETYSSLEGPIPREIVTWIGWPKSGHANINEHFIQLATLAIGNLSKLGNYPQFLDECNMAERLYDVINKAAEDQTRYLALDLLKHCFLKSSAVMKDPSISKSRPGLVRALNAVSGMNWMAAHASLSAARVMVTSANLGQLLEPIDVENSVSENGHRSASYWTRALQICQTTSIHDLKLAVGRLVAAVLRCTHSQDQSEGHAQTNGHQSPYIFPPGLDLAEPLGAMVSSSIDEGPRKMVHSEGWFAMALLAKSKEGAEMIVSRLRQTDINSALTKALGAGEESDSASPQKVHQRQNVIVMLKNIQSHGLEVQKDGTGQSIEELMSTLATRDVVLQQP